MKALSKGFETLEELMLLRQLGILDGDKNDDQLTKILGFMSLNSNRWMEDIRDYMKKSKNDDEDDNGNGRKKRRKNGGDFAAQLQAFNSLNLQSLYGQIEQNLQGIASGPNLAQIGLPSSYSFATWGNTPANDAKIIVYILNTLNFMTYLMSAQSQAERTEAFYALLESFEGSKMWGNDSNLGALLPITLLSGNGGFFNFGASLNQGALQIPKGRWTV